MSIWILGIFVLKDAGSNPLKTLCSLSAALRSSQSYNTRAPVLMLQIFKSQLWTLFKVPHKDSHSPYYASHFGTLLMLKICKGFPLSLVNCSESHVLAISQLRCYKGAAGKKKYKSCKFVNMRRDYLGCELYSSREW